MTWSHRSTHRSYSSRCSASRGASYSPRCSTSAADRARRSSRRCARGWLAHGIDRVAPPELSLGSDWLQFEYGEARFGTVLSHLGFSLYFLHHHLAGRDTAFDYARTYMAILRGLTIGGLFAYTPGLPFLEALLDAGKYRVRHVPFADPLRVPVLHDIERRSGLALSHATHVERRG